MEAAPALHSGSVTGRLDHGRHAGSRSAPARARAASTSGESKPSVTSWRHSSKTRRASSAAALAREQPSEAGGRPPRETEGACPVALLECPAEIGLRLIFPAAPRQRHLASQPVELPEPPPSPRAGLGSLQGFGELTPSVGVLTCHVERRDPERCQEGHLQLTTHGPVRTATPDEILDALFRPAESQEGTSVNHTRVR